MLNETLYVVIIIVQINWALCYALTLFRPHGSLTQSSAGFVPSHVPRQRTKGLRSVHQTARETEDASALPAYGLFFFFFWFEPLVKKPMLSHFTFHSGEDGSRNYVLRYS